MTAQVFRNTTLQLQIEAHLTYDNSTKKSKREISFDLTQRCVAQFVEAQILEDINKSNHVEMNSVSNLDFSPGWRHMDQIATISMAGTSKSESNKTRKEMERDNNEVAQDGVESTASQL